VTKTVGTAWLQRLRERGVIRVAASYAVITWLLLQIADVTFEPLGVPRWVMVSLIVTAILGFPVAVALAWFYEAGDAGVARDTAAEGVPRPFVHGLRRYADLAIIGVLLDGAGPYGDPYQVNSDNNGPYGDAVTQELIPHIERTYRGVGAGHDIAAWRRGGARVMQRRSSLS
jgi:hypothetical protein